MIRGVLTALLLAQVEPATPTQLALPEKPAAQEQPADQPMKELEELQSLSVPGEGAPGVATYYAKKFIGRKTSTGVRYDPEKMTAAHATLPFGTMVRVVNPKTGQDVVVEINDRCHPRHAPKNLIDLSRAAAKRIGLWGKGMIKVQIIPLERKAK